MEKKKNTPKLRFPEFKGEWEEKKLGEIFRISAGGDIDSKHVSKERTEKFNYPIYANTERDKGLYGYSDVYKIESGVVTVTGRGVNIGIAHARNHKFYPIVRLLVLEPLKEENIYFYEYQINRLNLYKESTGVPQLTAPQISIYCVCFPQLIEQTKIATFLTAVDEKLTQLKKKKTLLEQYKKGVMQKLFSQELRFKDDNNQDFPDWQEKTLGEMGETYNGLTGKNKDSFGTGKPYIQYKQIFDDSKIDVTRFELVEISYDEKQNKVKFGDIFFTVSSETPDEVGMSSVLLNEVEELYLNSFCFGYRPFSLQILSPFYARYLFRSEQFRKTVIVLAQGSTRYNLSKLGMMNLIIGLPSLPEQQKIATFLSSIDEKIIHCGKQIEKMEAWKKGLLQQMFC